MKKSRFSRRFFRLTTLISLGICLVILFSLETTPLQAQLNAPRDLTGTWQSSSSGMYYEMDAFGTGIPQADVTGMFAMDITQGGNQITIALYLNPISWVVDPAFTQMYGPDVTGAPPVAGEIDFSGTVSSSSLTVTETGGQLTSEQLTGTFTTDIITATLSGTAETTHTNGIVVTRTSSTTSEPTLSPTYTPATTNRPMAARYYGNIASIKGHATSSGSNGNTILSTGQIASGTEIHTGDNAIVGFEPPNLGGEVYLGANSDAGWLGLTSEPAPDNGIQYIVYPHVSSGLIFSNGGEQLLEMAGTVPLDVAIAVLVFSEPLGQAAAIGLIIEGGAFLITNGIAYVKENVSHLLVVPQGAIAGGNTEYTVSVASDGTTTVQVLDGPVYFIDPNSNCTSTVNTNQVLTLPPAQQNGFTLQELQSDVSSLNSTSVDHWWTQASTGTFSLNSSSNMSLIVEIVVGVILIVAVVAVTAAVVRKRRVMKQIHESESSAVLKLET